MNSEPQNRSISGSVAIDTVAEPVIFTERPRRMTLDKSEKLRHRSLVSGLFAGGRSEYAYPIRMVWRGFNAGELERTFRCGVPEKIGPVQFLITVPKKKQRHAVDRVLLRRRIREAYRLNRGPLYSLPSDRYISIAFIYLSDKQYDYARIEESVRTLVAKIPAKLQSDNDH